MIPRLSLRALRSGAKQSRRLGTGSAIPTEIASLTSFARNDNLLAHLSDYIQLTKPRLVSMILLSSATGYYLASFNFNAEWFRFWMMILGTALVASASMVLNQVLEIKTDALMVRTQNRPLPAARLSIREALLFGAAMSIVGFLILFFAVNWLSAAVAMVTWIAYLFVYTPLKLKTSLSTIVGAVPGALPPLIGWAGAAEHVPISGFVLFLIMFFWQLPHFLAIAWMYREDYERAGLPILSVIDREGRFLARQMILNMCALMPMSLLPTILGLTGTVYFFGAFFLGIAFAATIIFASSNLDLRARYVLRASVIYLALLLLLMIVGKL